MLKSSGHALAFLSVLLAAGCVPRFLIPPTEMSPAQAWPADAENVARITGFPMPAPAPLTPATGTVWPAAPVATPSMLDMLAQARPASIPRPAASAAARGDFGLCLPSPVHLDPAGHRSTAPAGLALGLC